MHVGMNLTHTVTGGCDAPTAPSTHSRSGGFYAPVALYLWPVVSPLLTAGGLAAVPLALLYVYLAAGKAIAVVAELWFVRQYLGSVLATDAATPSKPA